MTVDKTKLSYRNKVILAPMVRVGTLPMRLLALEYGADIVYSEELIDLKMVKAHRRVNDVLETIDFVDPSDGSIVFRTCEQEKSKVVLQLGTCDAERALQVGKLVENDIAALDINMGCPKEFSIKGGMGVALLGKPENAVKILKTLVDNLKIPVTCKIRILPTVEDTINLVNKFAATGISAIAIHCRTKDERPQHQPHPDVIKAVAQAVNIPIIANGGSREIDTYRDIFKFRDKCGVDSIMVARAAQLNVTIFRREGQLPVFDVIKKYLKLCVDYDNPQSNTKYCVQSMLKELQETPIGKRFLLCQTLHQICSLWDLGDYCYKKQLEYQEKGNFGRREVCPGAIPGNEYDDDAPQSKKHKSDKEASIANSSDIVEHNIAFYRANYIADTSLPKSILHTYASKNFKGVPKYEIQRFDKLFRAICSFDGKKYASTFWEKNKKYAEQGSALVCLLNLGLMEESELIKNGSILR